MSNESRTPQVKSTTLLSTINRCPPFLLYYLSHHGRGKRLSIAELVEDSGLTARTFTRVSRMIAWNHVKVAVMDGFCRACGLSPLDETLVSSLLRQELEAPVPFKDLDGHCRKLMVSKFNKLAARAVISDGH